MNTLDDKESALERFADGDRVLVTKPTSAGYGLKRSPLVDTYSYVIQVSNLFSVLPKAIVFGMFAHRTEARRIRERRG